MTIDADGALVAFCHGVCVVWPILKRTKSLLPTCLVSKQLPAPLAEKTDRLFVTIRIADLDEPMRNLVIDGLVRSSSFCF